MNKPGSSSNRQESDGIGDPSLGPGELLSALSGTALSVSYQPVMQLRERRVVGLEVLARLNHPKHGVLGPELFVPQMEQAGLARRLTDTVATLALADYVQHLTDLELTIAINLPLEVLLDCTALTALDARREAAGVPTGRILIELTESRPIDSTDASEMRAFGAAVRHLRDLGFGLALDDVGPETANLAALFTFGFTALKLDRSVVEGSANTPCAARFIRESAAVAHAGGLSVIAEGVADRASWKRMQELGVDQVQGFYIAHPLCAEAVPKWINTLRARSRPPACP